MGLVNDPGWVTPLLGGEAKDDDLYNLSLWRYALYSHWAFYFTAAINADNETEIRSGTDYLFQLAFQVQSGWKHHVK
jgi:hypothetical protein